MSVWKSIFLHEFLDGDPTNLHAIPGQLAVLPGGVVVEPPPVPTDRGFLVTPGRSLVYRFDEPLDDVIGVDLGFDLAIRPQEVPAFQLVSLGGGRVTLSMTQLRFAFIGPELQAFARIVLAVDGQEMEVDQTFPGRGAIRLRIRWHTHGQGQIWLEGTLRAYQPGFAAGRSFGLDRLVVGGPEGVIVDPGAVFRARRVYLKVLRRDDARSEIDKHVPLDDRYVQPTPCAERVRVVHRELLSRSRQFMAGIVSSLTTSWREGQPGGPFSREADAAHRAAVAAAEAFGSFLDTGDPAAMETFLERIGEFLDVLAATDPAGYADLLADLTARAEALDPYCREELQASYAANAGVLGPLAELLQRTGQRAREAQPGGPHA